MTGIEVTITDTARPELNRLTKKAANPIPGLNIAARGVANLVRASLRQKDKTANRLGGKRTYFWGALANMVQAPKQTGPNSVVVAISSPSLDPRRFGKEPYTLSAKRAAALTIPIHPDAHGRRASVLENELGIKLFRVKDVLMGNVGGKLVAFYALKKSVQLKPERDALPADETIQQTADAQFDAWLKR